MGDWSNIFNVFWAASKNNCEKIVCVGDFGYGSVKVVGLGHNKKEIEEQCVILENSSVTFL